MVEKWISCKWVTIAENERIQMFSGMCLCVCVLDEGGEGGKGKKKTQGPNRLIVLNISAKMPGLYRTKLQDSAQLVMFGKDVIW